MNRDTALRDNIQTLTDWERQGLEATYNLADGHAHFRLPAHLPSLRSGVSEFIDSAGRATQGQLELEFARAFFALAGQTAPAIAPSFHYSCSTTIDMAAKALAALGKRRVAILTPTFDNIPLLMRRVGLDVIPLYEEQLAADERLPERVIAECDAVFLVLPNNPTGWLPEEAIVRSVAEQLAAARRTLLIDFSFRFYSGLNLWDQYSFITAADGLDWILIEDTGKTWPTAEMKVGFCSCSENLRPAMENISAELLLNVSPFALSLLTALIKAEPADVGRSNSQQLACSEIARENRLALRSAIDGLPLQIESRGSEISVEWLRLPQPAAVKVCDQLTDAGVSILPGGPFWWSDRDRGDDYLRIALARETDYFARGAVALRRAFIHMAAGDPFASREVNGSVCRL